MTKDPIIDQIAEECFRFGVNVAVMEQAASKKHDWAPLSPEDVDYVISDEASNFLFEHFVNAVQLAIAKKIAVRRAETEAA